MTFQERLEELLDELGLDYKTFRTWLFGSSLADLSGLNTTDKSSIVAAINETRSAATGAPPDATESQKGIVVLASLMDMASGAGNKVATVAGVRQEREALKNEILGGVGPMADTLNELYTLAQNAEETAQINDLITLLGQKADADDVWNKTELGDLPNFDMAARYATAKQ